MGPGSQPEEECPASECAALSQVWAAFGGSYYFQNSLTKARTELQGPRGAQWVLPFPVLSFPPRGSLAGSGQRAKVQVARLVCCAQKGVCGADTLLSHGSGAEAAHGR